MGALQKYSLIFLPTEQRFLNRSVWVNTLTENYDTDPLADKEYKWNDIDENIFLKNLQISYLKLKYIKQYIQIYK